MQKSACETQNKTFVPIFGYFRTIFKPRVTEAGQNGKRGSGKFPSAGGLFSSYMIKCIH